MAPSFASHAPLSSGWGLVAVLHPQVDPMTAIPLSDDSQHLGRIHSDDSATEWQTNTRRKHWSSHSRLPGRRRDRSTTPTGAVSSFRPTRIDRLMSLGLPNVLLMRIRGSTTRMYEVTKTR